MTRNKTTWNRKYTEISELIGKTISKIDVLKTDEDKDEIVKFFENLLEKEI